MFPFTNAPNMNVQHFGSYAECISHIDAMIHAFEGQKNAYETQKAALMNSVIESENRHNNRTSEMEKGIRSNEQISSISNITSAILGTVGIVGTVMLSAPVGVALIGMGTASKLISYMVQSQVEIEKSRLDRVYDHEAFDCYLNGMRKSDIENSKLETLSGSANPTHEISQLDKKILQLEGLKHLISSDQIQQLPPELITAIFYRHPASII